MIGDVETLHRPVQTLVDGSHGLRVEIIDWEEALFSLFTLFLDRHFIFEQEIGRRFNVGRSDVANRQSPHL
jgi:hypothetical protein